MTLQNVKVDQNLGVNVELDFFVSAYPHQQMVRKTFNTSHVSFPKSFSSYTSYLMNAKKKLSP